MPGAPSDREGFTLIGVLVFCMILMPICASLARASRDLAYAVHRDVDDAKLEFLAGGIADAVAARLGSDRRLFDQLNGRWLTCIISGKVAALSIRDHDGKIDLNNASSELLIVGFEAAGVEHEEARLLQAFVEASRSNGTTPREISDLTSKVGLKHAPFEHVDELRDALSALGSKAGGLDRFFTVDSGVANVEQSTAAPELRARLRTLVNQDVVVEHNGSFEHVDVVVHLRSAANAEGVVLAKAFRRISAAGDVLQIRFTRLRSKWPLPDEPRRPDCIRLLALQGGA